MTYWFSNRAALHWFKHPLRMSSVDGYVGSSAGSELVDLIDLHVLCVNGEGCSLSLSPSTLGLEVRKAASEQLPTKKGAKLVLYHLASPLMLQQTLQEQGIEGKDCGSVLHLCSNRPIRSLEIPPRFPSL